MRLQRTPPLRPPFGRDNEKSSCAIEEVARPGGVDDALLGRAASLVEPAARRTRSLVP
jgi:hypothetical protein